jgi:drug/metabolite transporter (DMT)-like permease
MPCLRQADGSPLLSIPPRPPVQEKDKRRLFWGKVGLLTTGVFWGATMQLIVYQGGGHPLNQLPNIPWYLSFLLVYFFTYCRKDGRWHPTEKYVDLTDHQWQIVFPVGVFDWLGTSGLTIGLVWAGSAIFGIIYSSVTIWTALFAWCLLGRDQSAMQISGIFFVVGGLILPCLDNAEGSELEDLIVPGILITIAATIFYGLEYIVAERGFSLFKPRACGGSSVDCTQMCFQSGLWGLLITVIWIVVYTIPNWDELVTQEVERRNGHWPTIWLLYFLHTFNNAFHNWAWFTVCELEGGTSTGLLMGVKAALLFCASAAAFCSPSHPEQCITPLKLGAIASVLLGAVLYYWPEHVPLPLCGRWCQPRRADQLM